MIENGSEASWDEISREQLMFLLVEEKLSNAAIADMFGVSVSKVQYKRKKFGLSQAKIVHERVLLENREMFDELNEKSKAWLMDSKNIDLISKAVTKFAFRDGPVETVHSICPGFTDELMKEINISAVNHIAGLLTCALEGNWLQLRMLLDYFSKGTAHWYPAEPEIEKLDTLYHMRLRSFPKGNPKK